MSPLGSGPYYYPMVCLGPGSERNRRALGYDAFSDPIDRQAMERAGVEPGEIDILILSTATPDRLLPSTGCDTQALIGCDNAVAFDIQAACCGFIYGLRMAAAYIAAVRGDVSLVRSTAQMSAHLAWE